MGTVGDAAAALWLTSAPAFVGRERETAALVQVLARGPVVVLVEGEAGIGKTRFLQESLTAHADDDRRSLVAGCLPFRQPYTLGPIVDAVQQATDQVRGLGLSGLAGSLRPLFPEWADDLPPLPAALEDPAASRHRLFRALVELLYHLDLSVLVVEDVHWADEATLEFLLFLVSRQPPLLSLVVTYRPEDMPADSLLLRLSSRASPGMRQLRLALSPLDVTETGALVSSMLTDVQISTDFAEFLHEHTAGLPLALEETMRVMYDRADLTRRNGAWKRRHLRAIEVPPTVRDAVLERSGRLSLPARVLLDTAAVLGEPVREATLAAVSELTADETNTALAEVVRSGLLREDTRGLFAFRHTLATRAVYDAVPSPQRRVLHLRAGRTLQDRSPPPLAQLATHFREAGESAEWARYAEQAADVALAAGDGIAAALMLHEVTTSVELPVTDVERLIAKVPFVTFTGPALFREMLEVLRSALDRARLSPAEDASVRTLLGFMLLSIEEFEAARTELRHAVEHLPPRSTRTARSMMLLAQPRGSDSGEEHRRWLRRSLEAAGPATSATSPQSRLFFTMEHSHTLLLLGDEEGWTVAARIPSDVSTPTLRRGLAAARLNMGSDALLWGRYSEARQLLENTLEESERHEYVRLRDITLDTQARLDYHTGLWTGLADRVETLLTNDDLQPVTRMEAALVAALLHDATAIDASAVDAAEELLRRAVDVTTRHGATESVISPTAALARLRLAAGYGEEAVALTDWAAATIAHKNVWVWASDLVPVRVDALIAVGAPDRARDLVTAFARGLKGRTAPSASAALVSCRAATAQAAAQDPHDFSHAADLFGQAATAWQALPRPYDALLARERQADCLFAGGTHEAGTALLGDVLEGLSTLGAQPAADHVLRTLRRQGVDTRQFGRRGRPSYGDALSPRELDVVRLLGNGRTNRQIADALVVSVRTVDSHMRSAMRKLQAGSRTALAIRVAELGLTGEGSSPPRGQI